MNNREEVYSDIQSSSFVHAKTVLETEYIVGKKLLITPTMDLVEIHIAPGGELAPHKTPMDTIFYIVSGKGKVTIGDAEITVKKGDSITSPKEIPHGIVNKGKTPLIFLVMKLLATQEE